MIVRTTKEISEKDLEYLQEQIMKLCDDNERN